jgi:hypothetical protein
MNTTKLIVITMIIVALIAGIVGLTYSIMGGRAKVIKAYSYPGSVANFIIQVKSFAEKDSTVIAKTTDTTGTVKIGFEYYMDIELKNNRHDILYTIACENINKGEKTGASIELVLAYDKINNIGGYNKKAQGVIPLISIFDEEFLKPLSTRQNIKIMPL